MNSSTDVDGHVVHVVGDIAREYNIIFLMTMMIVFQMIVRKPRQSLGVVSLEQATPDITSSCITQAWLSFQNLS